MANVKTENGKYFDNEKWDNVNPVNKMLMTSFLQGKRNLSPTTLHQYRNSLQIFFIWVYDNRDNAPLNQLRRLDMLMYQNWLLDEGLSAGTIRHRRSAVSSLCDFVLLYFDNDPDFIHFSNIVDGVEPPSGGRVYKKEPLTVDELKSLRRELKRRKSWQQLAYLELSYSTGARREEIRQLERSIVDAEPIKSANGTVFYRTHEVRGKGKGIEGDVKRLSFSQRAMDAVKLWLEERDKDFKERGVEDNCKYVFVSSSVKNGANQVSKSAFNSWCARAFTEIVGRRIHPHLLRSTRATHLVVEEGRSLTSAQQLLGHKDSSTTEIYVVTDRTEEIGECF